MSFNLWSTEKDAEPVSENYGGDFFLNSKKMTGKQRLEKIQPKEFKSGGWFPVEKLSYYHTGNSKTIAEGTCEQRFAVIDKSTNIKYLAIAILDPLEENPVNPDNIRKIEANSPYLVRTPIVYMVNLVKIQKYEKNEKTTTMESDEMNWVGSKINMGSLDEIMAFCVCDSGNKRPDLLKRDCKINSKIIKNVTEKLNHYYDKIDKEINQYYSDDEESTIGEPLVKCNSEKPDRSLWIAIKFLDGKIKWYEWVTFRKYKNDESMSQIEKSQITKSLKILEKSQPSTWSVFSGL